jgi:protein-tyrosine-phosphatase
MARVQGVELAAHRSRLVGPGDLVWADTIVLMDRHNWQALVQHGAAAQRFVWLGVLDGGETEVVDPYDASDLETQAVVNRLHLCTERLAALISENRATNGE